MHPPKNKNQAMLADVARRLASQEGRHEELRDQTIARWVQEAAAEFIGAPVQIYVPLLVEHLVRQRIAAPSPRRRATAGTS